MVGAMRGFRCSLMSSSVLHPSLQYVISLQMDGYSAFLL